MIRDPEPLSRTNINEIFVFFVTFGSLCCAFL